jgi:hypothetical protein
MFFGPFHKSKKYVFNYASKEKNLNEKEIMKKKEYYNNQTKIYDKKILKNKRNNRCKNKNIKTGFYLEKRNKINSNISKIKNSKSPTINKIKIKNLEALKKDSLINDNSTSYNTKKKKNINISINYKKNSFKNNPINNNKITVNQIIQTFKNQIKHNIISNEHIVKSERISPLKNEVLSNKKNNNISKELSKKKVEKKNNNAHKIKHKSIISQDTQSIKINKDKIKNSKDKKNNKLSKVENECKYFEIEISNSKDNSFNDSDTSSYKLSNYHLSELEIESGNKKICSIDSLKSLKDSKKNNSEDSTNKKKNKEKKEKEKEEEEEEKTIINIDIPIEIKKKDPQYLNEYIEDILETLLIEENKFLKKKYINPHYLENPDSELTPEMRTVAVDWLVLIHHKIFKFKENTFFLAVQIFDRFLSDIILTVEKTELLLLTSFALASKHEEVEYVNMQETLQLAQKKFTKEDIIHMEYEILKQIKFEVLAPTMCDYFKIFAFLMNYNNDKLFQGLYILNIILVDFHMLEYPNCSLALAVTKLITKKINLELLEIVNKIIKKHQLECLEKFTNIRKINSLCNKIKLLYDTFLETKYKNIPEKFAESQYNCVSIKTSI